MSQLAGITEKVMVWMVLVAPYNTTITFPDVTTGTRNNLFGLLADSDFSPEINNNEVSLFKQAFGGNTPTDKASGGQSAVFSFGLNTIGKDDVKKILSDVATETLTGVTDPTDGKAGTLEGNAEAGRQISSYRFLFVPAYALDDGTYKPLTDETNKDFWHELPKANIRNGFNPTFSSSEYATYDLEVEAWAELDNKLWRVGSEIELVIT